jgi:hypothetical protein
MYIYIYVCIYYLLVENFIYWYKSTNTDAEGAAPQARMWACRAQVVSQILTHNTTCSSDAAGAGKEAFGGKKNWRKKKSNADTHTQILQVAATLLERDSWLLKEAFGGKKNWRKKKSNADTEYYR